MEMQYRIDTNQNSCFFPQKETNRHLYSEVSGNGRADRLLRVYFRGEAMEITNVKVTTVDDPSLKAIATITFDGCFVVKGIKVVKGERGLFVAMPSRKLPDLTYQDVAYPSTKEMADKMRGLIMDRYRMATSMSPTS
jgi:stage V sporulation protein G